MNPGYSRMDISNHVQSSCQITGSRQFVTILMSVLPTQKKQSQRDSPHRDTDYGVPLFQLRLSNLCSFGSEILRLFFCFYAGCISKKCLQTWPQKCFHQLMATSIFKICRCESPNSSPYITHSERWCMVHLYWWVPICRVGTRRTRNAHSLRGGRQSCLGVITKLVISTRICIYISYIYYSIYMYYSIYI